MRKFIFIAILCLAACTTVTRQDGAELHQVKLDQISPGTSKGDIYKLLGSPSTKSVYGIETWYYISGKIQKQLIEDDVVLEQSVVAISFDDNGNVSNLEVYDKNNRRDFATSERVTPTAGKALGVVEQVLGNVGKFNNDTSGATIGSRAPSGGKPY